MKKKILKKAIAYEMILLFIGLSIIPISASGEEWRYAHIDGSISDLGPDDITWGFAVPFFKPNKIYVFNLIFNAFEGEGYIDITPLGKTSKRYYFPEDFTYLGAMVIFAPGLHFIRYGLDLEGEKYILSIDGYGIGGVEIGKY